MPNVAFLSSDYALHLDPITPNGCTWYRCILPARALKHQGWDAAVGFPGYSDEYGLGVTVDGGIMAGYEINVFKLLMHKNVIDIMQAMQANGQKIVVDIDDFHQGIHSENMAASVTNPHLNQDVNRAYYEQIIRLADTVIVSTEFLLEWYERRVRNITMVRNALDAERYAVQVQPEIPTFGWVGATPWRSKDVEVLAAWLPGFVKDHKVKVHHSGHIPDDPKPFAKRAGLKNVSMLNMVTMPDYPSLFEPIHVGFVPLRMNDFNEAKSFIKGLEYAASGIPFIASPTKEYELLAEAGVGRLAWTPDEWRDHAEELLDPDVRREEGARIAKIVRDEFGVKGEAWATAILS